MNSLVRVLNSCPCLALFIGVLLHACSVIILGCTDFSQHVGAAAALLIVPSMLAFRFMMWCVCVFLPSSTLFTLLVRVCCADIHMG